MKKVKTAKARRLTLIYTTAISLIAVLSAGVSTYAWFTTTALATASTVNNSANVTVAAPDVVRFYCFKGNGNPGSGEYTGYSKSGAAYGNTTNVIDTTNHKFSTYALSNQALNVFATAWQEIDITSNSTSSGVYSAKNCFNFSRMRVGCYYSFCVVTQLSSTNLTLGYDWSGGNGITGDGVSPKRYVYANGNTTNNPLNVLMAINGYCKIQSNGTTNSQTYIEESVGVGSSLGLTDKIGFTPVGTGTTSASYQLLNAGNTSSNRYVYFTVFMGNSSDAFIYQTTSNSIEYYQINQSTNYGGIYSPLDGLKSTLSTVTVS